MKSKPFLLITSLIILLGGLVYFTAPYPYWFAKMASVVRPGNEESRTAYRGQVKITPTTIEGITAALQENGCKEQKETAIGIDGNCYYKKTGYRHMADVLEVFPQGAGFGPVSFFVSEEVLFFSKDIREKPNMETLKRDVREDASLAGVEIQERTWKFDSVKYPWDVIY
jgi:hypothetical protein